MKVLLISLLAIAGNTKIDSFNEAKKLLRLIYTEHRITIYSGCSYNPEYEVDYSNCGWVSRSNSSRSRKVEWEHVVPASTFGKQFPEWSVGDPECVDRKGKKFKGRNCAAKVNMTFRHIEADMYNLFPEIGEVNNLRSDYVMAELPAAPLFAPPLQMKIAHGKFEPRDQVKGDIARTYLYMDESYPEAKILTPLGRAMLQRWAAADPPDKWECERSRRIARIQGNINKFVEQACQANNL